MYDAGPQGLNRYSYALNNPILYRDPTGHFISGPDDDPNPTAYGNVTGSQEQIADGTATIHDGSDGSSNQPLSNAEGFLVADPRIYASPYPTRIGTGPVGYVKVNLQDLERQLYDEGGSVQQRIVDTQQGMVDELVSQYASVAEMTDQTGGVLSGLQIRLVSWASERVMNISYDTASGGLRPRENSLWYKTGKYGMAVIIFLATIEAGGNSKTSKSGMDVVKSDDLPFNLKLSRHAQMERMAERGVTKKMIDVTLQKGQTFWDPKNKTVVSILNPTSGKNVGVAASPVSKLVTTVMCQTKSLVRPRFKAISRKLAEKLLKR